MQAFSSVGQGERTQVRHNSRGKSGQKQVSKEVQVENGGKKEEKTANFEANLLWASTCELDSSTTRQSLEEVKKMGFSYGQSLTNQVVGVFQGKST